MRAVSWAMVAGSVCAAMTGFVIYRHVLDEPDPTGAIAVCEGVLQNELRSPSTYKRVSAKFTLLPPLTFREYLAYNLTANCGLHPDQDSCTRSKQLSLSYVATDKEVQKQTGVKITTRNLYKARDQAQSFFFKVYEQQPLAEKQTGMVEIVYDAVNAYNAPIRGTKVCRLGQINHDDKKYHEDNVFDPEVDVRGITGWSLTPVKVNDPDPNDRTEF